VANGEFGLSLIARDLFREECQMTTRMTPRIALLGIPLGIFFLGLFGRSQAQQVDLNAAANAKANAGREALSHPVTDPPGPKAAGSFITFDAPGAGTGFFEGTFPASINQAGDITGSYVDANGVGRGFVRASHGAFTTFDVPGGTTTGASSINPAGAVTGTYLDNGTVLPEGSVLCILHSFLRARDGAIALFDAPGADTNPVNCGNNGTQAVDINPEGVILGYRHEQQQSRLLAGERWNVHHV
jgi:hypothetical protein